MNILFVAAEATPLIKVGGLADVTGSLPGALNALGHDVRTILPKYSGINLNKDKFESIKRLFTLSSGQPEEALTLWQCKTVNGSIFYLIENDNYFATKEIYGGKELNRFFFFDKAVMEVLPELQWKPDVLHCHDWHTALMPLFLKKGNINITSIITIHNLAYQGPFDNIFLKERLLKKPQQ